MSATVRALLALAALAVLPVRLPAVQHDAGAASLRIGWDEFKPLYDAGSIIVIDVRDANAYRAGHIPGARSMPADRIDTAAPDLVRLKTPLVLYCACQSEHTSAEAAEALRRHGADARALVGGWNKWYEATGGRVERGAPRPR